MMALFACGLNHKSAPLEIRECFTASKERYQSILHQALSHPAISEAAIVSTCNRTEFYCSTTSRRQVLAFLSDTFKTKDKDLRQHIYMYNHHKVVRHMMRVASGLDSMVLGEPQILGQIKQAFHAASEAGGIGRHLGSVFRSVFSSTKRIRTHTAIGVAPVSIAYAGVSLVQQVFEDLSNVTVLFVGAGETIELAARHLCERGVKKHYIANRSIENTKVLAQIYGATALSIGDIPSILSHCDIVISATASQLPILGKGIFESILRQRKHRPMVLLDLAVPRDIEPEVASLADIYLYNIDDLENIICDNQNIRLSAAHEAEQIIEHEVQKYLERNRAIQAAQAIRAYRETLNNHADTELKRAQQLLENGADAADILQELTHRLVHKALHTPTQKLRTAGTTLQQDILKLTTFLYTP